MATIFIIWLFVKLWKKAISLSDKLPTKVWDTLVVGSSFLFCISIVAFLYSPRQWNEVKAVGYSSTISGRIYPSSESKKGASISVGNYDFPPLSDLSLELLSISACETAVHLEWSDGSEPSHNTAYSFRVRPYNSIHMHISSHFSFSTSANWIGTIAHETGISNNPAQTIAPPAPPVNKQEPVRDFLFWILVFNAVATGLNMVSTIILAWISHKRLQAELLLKKYEAELKLRELQMKEAEAKLKLKQMELEILKAEQELAKARSSPLVIPAV